jgi:glycosyltransferase involved in cell wall biosynthesis
VPFGRTDLAPAIQSFSPDVVNMANLPGLGYGNVEAVRHLGVPVVLTVADFAPLCAGTTMFRKTEQCEERCLKCRIISGPRLSRFNRADAYIFVSEYMRNRYVATNGHADEAMSRGSVIHNGLDDCMINMPLPPTIEARSSAVGFMGQLKPTKGIEVLIRAFLKGAERREARLVIAGSGETAYVEALKRLAGGDRRVEFIGHSDPVRFFERVDIVVIPSVWAEPLPRVGYEANFFGRPIIVSNKGGCSELVENDENGSVFDPDHDMQLSGLIDVWFARLQRHRSEISQAARAHALKRHHPDIVAQRYEDALTASTRVPAGKAA